MPVARFQMPDGRVARFEVPEGTSPEQAQAMIAQHFAEPKAAPRPSGFMDKLAHFPSPLDFVMSKGSQSLMAHGFSGNFSDRLAGVGGVIGNAIAAPLSDKVDFNPAQAYEKAVGQRRTDIARQRRTEGAGGAIAEIAGATLPMLAVVSAPKLFTKGAPLATKALQTAKALAPTALSGAFFGAGRTKDLTNAQDLGNNMLTDAGQAVAGDLIGRGLVKAGGKVLSATLKRTPEAQRLVDRNIPVTIGQALGGRFKNVEDRLGGLPGSGGAIRQFRRGQFEDVLRKSADDVLEPLGVKAPPAADPRELYAATKDIADSAYARSLAEISGPVDEKLTSALATPSTLTGPQRSAYEDFIQSEIAPRIKEDGTLVGEDVQAIKEALDDQIKSFRNTPGYRGLANHLSNVRTEVLDFAGRNAPDGGKAYSAARQAYGRAKTLQTAIEASGPSGIPTPRQISLAARQSAKRMRSDAYARGLMPLQALADDASAVLPSAIPDPGTAGQLGFLDILNHPLRNGPAAIAGMAMGGLYNRPVNAALQKLLFDRPDILLRAGKSANKIAAPAGALVAGSLLSGR